MATISYLEKSSALKKKKIHCSLKALEDSIYSLS